MDGDEEIVVEECTKESVKLEGMQFESLLSAFEFYKSYAYSKGFSVRKHTTRNDAEGNRIQQEFCCSKQGTRRNRVTEEDRTRPHRPTTRTGCNANVRLACQGPENWTIIYADDNHNHDLSPPIHAPFLRAQRRVSEADLAEAIALKESGMRTTHIYNYFVQTRGGFDRVGFLAKDLYNALEADSRAQIQTGDIDSVLAYFKAKEDVDLGFYIKYTVDDSNRMHNLFWADSISRSDYTSFGDVIAFDTTYKNNAYDRPLMPTVGLNHHHQTVVFGRVVMADQTTESFQWVLRTFLDAMGNKPPRSVVTDGDRAMENAIKSTFPTATHRLCSWHLARNAQTNIGDPKFVRIFSKCMKSWWTTTEFDQNWTWMVREFNVENNAWRCKSMNATLGRYLKAKKTYIDFVRAIEQGIARMRHNEAELDYKSANSKPYHSHPLKDLEAHAAQVYTIASFGKFMDELKEETLFVLAEPMSEVGSIHTYYLVKYKTGGQQIKVEFDVNERTILCTCQKFETTGFPCSHCLHVLKEENITCLPESFILKRWTKNVKLSVPSYVDAGLDEDVIRRRRFGSLSSRSNRLNYFGSLTDEAYIQVGGILDRGFTEIEKNSGVNAPSNDGNNKSSYVRDPARRKSKVKQKVKKESKPRQCSYCGMEGHNRKTCPDLELELRGPTSKGISDDYGDGGQFWQDAPSNDNYEVSGHQGRGMPTYAAGSHMNTCMETSTENEDEIRNSWNYFDSERTCL